MPIGGATATNTTLYGAQISAKKSALSAIHAAGAWSKVLSRMTDTNTWTEAQINANAKYVEQRYLTPDDQVERYPETTYGGIARHYPFRLGETEGTDRDRYIRRRFAVRLPEPSFWDDEEVWAARTFRRHTLRSSDNLPHIPTGHTIDPIASVPTTRARGKFAQFLRVLRWRGYI